MISEVLWVFFWKKLRMFIVYILRVMRKTMRKSLIGILNLFSLKANLNVRTTLMKLKVVNFMVKLQINANLGMAMSL